MCRMSAYNKNLPTEHHFVGILYSCSMVLQRQSTLRALLLRNSGHIWAEKGCGAGIRAYIVVKDQSI